jgi:hypothetical protein
MTAPEVCQYVNQALRNEYISISTTTRYEMRYTALSAVYGETGVADEEMNRTIKALSPEALRIFKEELRERLKAMTPQEREPVLSRIRGISEVEDIVREYEGVFPEGEGTWLVNVKVAKEPQMLREGRWVVTRALVTETYTQQYYFSETTGALTKR